REALRLDDLRGKLFDRCFAAIGAVLALALDTQGDDTLAVLRAEDVDTMLRLTVAAMALRHRVAPEGTKQSEAQILEQVPILGRRDLLVAKFHGLGRIEGWRCECIRIHGRRGVGPMPVRWRDRDDI